MKDVMTPAIEEEQKAAITQMVDQAIVNAKANNDDIQNGKALDYVEAAIAFTVTGGQNDGVCQGYITYQDTGKVLHFYGTQTFRTGTEFNSAGAFHSAKVLPYEMLANVEATYEASGFFIYGSLNLTCNGRNVFSINLPLGAAAAPRSWASKGVGRFTSV